MQGRRGPQNYQRYQMSSGAGGLTPMVQRIMIVNAAVWIVQQLANRSLDFDELFAVSNYGVFSRGFVWQPFTYMWLHSPSILHILSNMFSLYMFGPRLEMTWGSQRFLQFYLLCGTGAGVFILAWNWVFGVHASTYGASGAVYGVLAAFSILWRDQTIMLLIPPIPIKAIYLVPLLFVLNVISSGTGTVSHSGHLGGALVAFFILRDQLRGLFSLSSIRLKYHRWRMRKRLRAVQRDEWNNKRH